MFLGKLGYVTCAHIVMGTARVAQKSWLRACVCHSHFVSLYYIHAVHARCVRTFLLLYCLQLCLSEPISLKLQWSYFTVRIHFYCLIT